MDAPQYQIIDLDGCIADDRHRRHLIVPDPGTGRTDAHFRRYHEESHCDLAANLHEVRWADCSLIVLTSRPLAYFEITRNWLLEVAALPVPTIIMRNPGDRRSSVEVKREQLSWLPVHYAIPYSRIVEAIDDRDDIVEMYREAGLNARVVRIGEESSL